MKKILSVTKDGDIAYIKKEYKLEQTQKVRKKNVVTTQYKLNSIQREMYRRLMYGLNNYTEQQRNLMSINQITKIVKDYEKAKKVLHIMKCKKFYIHETKLFDAIFPHCKTRDNDSDWYLKLPKEATLNKLNISPKDIIEEFIRRKLLPNNFYKLT